MCDVWLQLCAAWEKSMPQMRLLKVRLHTKGFMALDLSLCKLILTFYACYTLKMLKTQMCVTFDRQREASVTLYIFIYTYIHS